MGAATSGVPDMGALMFPSSDPLAYPAQQAMTSQSFMNPNDFTQRSLSDLANGSPTLGQFADSNQFDATEGQLFGQLPSWLFERQTFQGNRDLNFDQILMSGSGNQNMNFDSDLISSPDANLHQMFDTTSTRDNWGSMDNQRHSYHG